MTNFFPVAITGMGVRFPGNVFDEHSFWDLISNARDAIVPVPEGRWNIDKFYDPDPDAPGKMYVNKGGFLQSPIDEFDALFFGITPREADTMDPQQRLVLQVVWEALHSAGIVPEKLAGTDTGVYVGAFTLDNLLQQMGPLSRALIGPHTAVGSTMTILSNRISYLLDIHGPSVSMDTACSSSLVAVHQACRSIWSGECAKVIVAGVNVMFRPEYLISMCKGKFLAKDGHCKSFDERADGYARGEGAGALVLKPLADAERDGDIIRGIIRITGVNQDGRSQGITSPNSEAQINLMKRLHKAADVTPDQIAYVEAHGTGTQAGDTAETTAIGEAVGKHRGAIGPVPIGSIKANIGHLEAASGIAGLVKTMLCLKHKQIPAVANLENLNPKIPFDELGLHVPRQPLPMSRCGTTAYAAVNSFGYGGTNAHVLLQEVPERAISAGRDLNYYLLPISAKDKNALMEMAKAYQKFLSASSTALSDICYSSANRRGHYQYRLAIGGQDKTTLCRNLDEFITYQQSEMVKQGSVSGELKRPVFVLTGMGPQWWAMGRELYLHDPVYHATATEVDQAFEKVSGWSILKEMMAEESSSRMSSTEIAQPANFLIQVSLAAMWRELGIEPAAIVGHSVGEVSAAYLSGVLTLDEAAKVSYYRSKIQSKAAGQGGMLAVGLTQKEAETFIAKWPNAKLDIAAVNSPNSLTLSGDEDVLAQIAKELDEQGIFQRALQVEIAYHSAYMDPLMPEMEAALASLCPKEPQIPLYSTVTGERVYGSGCYGAKYWCQNARQAVLFAHAIQSMLRDGHDLFLELGPHPVLSTSIKQCATEENRDIHSVASLNRKKPELETFYQGLGELYSLGCAVAWSKLYDGNLNYVDLPMYPWQNTKYWAETSSSYRDRLAVPEHPLLGHKRNDPTPCWSSSLNKKCHPYLPDHRVENLVVLPGAGYVELGLAIQKIFQKKESSTIFDLKFFQALIVSPLEEPELHTSFNASTQEYFVHSRSNEDGAWVAHASGQISNYPPSPPSAINLELVLERMQSKRVKEEHYEIMHLKGLQYGDSFQGLQEVFIGDKEILGLITVPEKLKHEVASYCLHPAVLDACFQAMLSILPVTDHRAFVPTDIREIRYHGQIPEKIYCYSTLTTIDEESLTGNLCLCDMSGNVLVELFHIKARALSQTERLGTEIDDWLYKIEWEEQDLPASENHLQWLVIGDTSDDCLAAQLAKVMSKRTDVATASFGDSFQSDKSASFVVNPQSVEDLTKLLDTLMGISGIVFLPPTGATGANAEVDDAKTMATLSLIQAMARSGNSAIQQLCVITSSAQIVEIEVSDARLNETGIIGLLRAAANEYPEYTFRCVDTAGSVSLDALAAEVLAQTDEHEVALRAGRRLVMRMNRESAESAQRTSDKNAKAQPEYRVDLTSGSVALTPIHRQGRTIGSNHVKIAISTTMPNDLKPAAEDGVQQSTNYDLTTRLVSCHANGKMYLHLLRSPLTSHINDDIGALIPAADFQIDVQQYMSTLLFGLAARCIVKELELEIVGKSILVHSADSPIGLMLVQLATNQGSQVFVTIDSAENEHLLKHYKVAGCFNSANLEFAEMTHELTGGQGVDYVINTKSGEYAQRSLGLIKSGGKLLDFSGKALIVPSGISVSRLNINQLLDIPSQEITAMLMAIEADILAARIHPFVESQVELTNLPQRNAEPRHAFNLNLESTPPAALFKAEGVSIDSESTYLVSGGFGGFGQLVVRRLVERGAKHILIMSRSGAKTAEDQIFLADLKLAGIAVAVARVDISDAKSTREVLTRELEKLPPLKGIVHTAGILDDGPINFIQRENLLKVMRPKVYGAWNLHTATLHCELDFFVLFSSVGSLIGAAGQATYVISNTWLDAFAAYRRALNLPASSLSWGALGEVGMAAIDADVTAYFERVGIRPIGPIKAIDAFERSIGWNFPHLGIVDIDWGLWGSYYPAWAKSPRYAHLMPEIDKSAELANDWLQVWMLKDETEQLEDIIERVRRITADTMKIPLDKVGPDNSLPELGIDSLIAMELQSVFQKELNVRISTLELMKGNSLRKISANIRTNYLDTLQDANPRPAETDDSDHLGNLSADQFDELLAEMTED